MTDEARRLYYSPGHWEGMLKYQLTYVDTLRSRKYDLCSSRALLRHSFLMGSAYGRLDYFQVNFNIMRGLSQMKWKRKASLLINGINYGLMLEGLRQKIHADIEDKFEKSFIGLASEALHFGVDFGSPAGDKTVVTIFDEWPVYREYKKPTTPAPDDEEEDDIATAVYHFRKARGYYDPWYKKFFNWLRSLTPWT